jgi:hypothetical protein
VPRCDVGKSSVEKARTMTPAAVAQKTKPAKPIGSARLGPL